MARQKGIFKVKGSLGGVTFYELNGADLLRESNGPSAEKIKNDPSFQRTRENNQEFTGSANAGKALRMAVTTAFPNMTDGLVTSRVTKICRQVIERALTGVRGQRPFLPAEHKELLLNFPYSDKVTLDSVLQAPYSVAVSAARNSAALTIPDFNTTDLLNAPPGATHFRIHWVLGILSSYEFAIATNSYVQMSTAENMLNHATASAHIPIGGMMGLDLAMTTALPGAPAIPADCVAMAGLGVEFYQFVSGNYYLLASNNAMKIVDVV